MASISLCHSGLISPWLFRLIVAGPYTLAGGGFG